MKGIDKIAKVVTKIVEICHWVATGLMAAATLCAAFAPKFIGYFVSFDAKECCGAELSVYGFELTAKLVDGEVDKGAFIIFGIGATLILALMAMIFRNLNIFIKRSVGTTPFQKDNVRLLREIGIFSIAAPIVGFIMSTVARIALGAGVEASNSLSGFIIGIVVLCITEFFAEGIKLEEDVDGLV